MSLQRLLFRQLSGRAAIVLPIFLALPEVLKGHQNLIKALALLCPAVILLSVVGSYLGAGAHLITNQILSAQGYSSFSLLEWLWLGLPFALVSSIVCTELVLQLFTQQKDRQQSLQLACLETSDLNVNFQQNGLSVSQKRVIAILLFTLVLWLSEPIHQISATMVAILGALLIAAPGFGCIKFSQALKSVPWALLIFMAATLSMGSALIESGAIVWLSDALVQHMSHNQLVSPVIFTIFISVFSLLAHLFIQSRSVVLIPIVISLDHNFMCHR